MQSFWDLLSIRYDWGLKGIPSHYACGNTFNLQHALQCPKSGFVTLRLNHIRNTTANLLTEVLQGFPCRTTIAPVEW